MTKAARVRRARTVATVLALMAAVLVVGAPPASALTCTLNGHVVNASVQQTGDDFPILVRDSGELIFTDQDCGPISQIDTVNVDMGHAETSFDVDLRGGPIGPGFTPEDDGTSEIEIDFTNADPHGGLTVIGTSGDDDVTFGQRLVPIVFVFERQANLNAGAEGSSPDVDVTWRSSGGSGFLSMGGNDRLRATGIGTGTSDAATQTVDYFDGSGTDRFVGGAGDDNFFSNQRSPNDVFDGGAGSDTVQMDRPAGVSITENGVADDGEECPGVGCEGDDIGADVERISTGQGPDHLVGAPGHQEFFPGGGDNTVFGGPGNDLIFATGDDADLMHGGAGTDRVSYSGHQQAVTVTLDGKPNDGATAAEGDNVFSDVEAVEGSSFGDQIRGGPGDDHLCGEVGNDLLCGGGGNDVLDGGRCGTGTEFVADGSDSLSGGSGTDTVVEAGHDGNLVLSIDGVANDRVAGHPGEGTDNIALDVENVVAGADTIRGSAANNRLEGRGGGDDLQGLAGNDRLIGGAGGDSLDGGAGTDTCLQGPGTGPKTSCEH